MIELWRGVPLSRKASFILAFLLICLGSICVYHIEHILIIFPYLCASSLIIGGIVATIHGFKSNNHKTLYFDVTSIGVVSFIVGLVIVYQGPQANVLIGAIWGIIGVYKSAKNLIEIVDNFYTNKPIKLRIVELIIELPLSILLLLDPAGKLPHHLLILGLEQIFVGIQIILYA